MASAGGAAGCSSRTRVRRHPARPRRAQHPGCATSPTGRQGPPTGIAAWTGAGTAIQTAGCRWAPITHGTGTLTEAGTGGSTERSTRYWIIETAAGGGRTEVGEDAGEHRRSHEDRGDDRSRRSNLDDPRRSERDGQHASRLPQHRSPPPLSARDGERWANAASQTRPTCARAPLLMVTVSDTQSSSEGSARWP